MAASVEMPKERLTNTTKIYEGHPGTTKVQENLKAYSFIYLV